MSMWRKVIPNLFTLGAMAASVMSIIKAGEGDYTACAQLIMLALALDGLDGNVARWVHGETKFGAELDTFIDITAYGIAPAVLAWDMVMKDHGFWGVAFVCFTAMSGAMRLARFRVVDPFRGQQGYLGLPITVNAGWVAMFAIMTQSGVFEEDGWFSITGGPLAAVVWTSSLVFLVLQVSNVRYSKPTKAPLAFAFGLIMIMMLFLKQEVMVAAALAFAAYAIYYGFLTPFFPKHAALIETAADEEEEEDSAEIRHS